MGLVDTIPFQRNIDSDNFFDSFCNDIIKFFSSSFNSSFDTTLNQFIIFIGIECILCK